MVDPEFDERLERVRKAAEVISGLPTKTLQAEAFHYLLGQPLPKRTKTPSPEPVAKGEGKPEPSAHAITDVDAGSPEKSGSPANGKKSGTKRARPSSVSPDKALELAPSGKQSFAEFVAEKKPTTHIEKYTVCVYWMLEVAEYPKATISQIVTCYHAMNWTLPTDIRNTASQAGKKQFDNTGGLDDIKLSTLGRNLILGLPKQDPKKK